MGSTLGGPYHQTFGYDVFSNMKDRTGQLWSAPGDAYSTGYVNDRNSAWTYDGAGNPTTQETLTAKYNSAGQRSSTTSPARHIGSQIVNLKLFEGYDGDGQQVAETEETTVGSTTTQSTRLICYIRGMATRLICRAGVRSMAWSRLAALR